MLSDNEFGASGQDLFDRLRGGAERMRIDISIDGPRAGAHYGVRHHRAGKGGKDDFIAGAYSQYPHQRIKGHASGCETGRFAVPDQGRKTHFVLGKQLPVPDRILGIHDLLDRSERVSVQIGVPIYKSKLPGLRGHPYGGYGFAKDVSHASVAPGAPHALASNASCLFLDPAEKRTADEVYQRG
jgi:hypothetical protein